MKNHGVKTSELAIGLFHIRKEIDSCFFHIREAILQKIQSGEVTKCVPAHTFPCTSDAKPVANGSALIRMSARYSICKIRKCLTVSEIYIVMIERD